MMRANLLPRRRDSIGFLGARLTPEDVRAALVALAVVLAVTLTGVAFESVRLHRLQNAALDAESAVEARAAERSEATRTALDVARYQEIARESAIVRRSGTVAATLVARIGNSVPAGVWLNSIAHDAGGFELAGASRSIDALSGAIQRLGSALPGGGATLVDIDNRDGSEDSVRFTARLREPMNPAGDEQS